ncbi:MAG: hypothetical protein QOF02_3730 [Blastocatellia bacterium]|nr:hypothetical protein [Blastocatellia bacterium]
MLIVQHYDMTEILSMSKAVNKKAALYPKMTIGVLVETLEPSQIKTVVTVSVTFIVAVFFLGGWMVRNSYEWEKQAHIVSDELKGLKFYRELEENQRKLQNAEAEIESLKRQNEQVRNHLDVNDTEITTTRRLPRKDPAIIIVVTKRPRKFF